MGNRFTSTTRETGAGLTENNPLTVIIPVAGMGYRMKSYGPKCLLKANQQQTIKHKAENNPRTTKKEPNKDANTALVKSQFKNSQIKILRGWGPRSLNQNRKLQQRAWR